MWRHSRARSRWMVLAGVAVVVVGLWLGLKWQGIAESSGSDSYADERGRAEDARNGESADPTGSSEFGNTAAKTKDGKPLSKDKREVSDPERAELIPRAQLWRQPRVPIGQASLAGTTVDEVSCRFKVTDLGGTTPKFDCELESGEEIRIKYGNGPEVPAEAAATRLIRALGFGADDITIVRTLRCYGCPKEPFSMMRTVELTKAGAVYARFLDFDEYEEFEWVAMERKFNARPIETDNVEGWSFFELDRVDAAKGGAPRAHVDGLRLLAVLLAHWDNKSENQRLVCLARDWDEDTACPSPFLLLQDVGATFGPTKFDLEAWRKAPVWEDRAACTVSMRTLPFEGATFGRAVISEEGRAFAARLLSQLTERQLSELFTHARFAEKRGVFTPSHSVADWIGAFEDKVRAITEGPPCPAA
jgi:hypothetical protein